VVGVVISACGQRVDDNDGLKLQWLVLSLVHVASEWMTTMVSHFSQTRLVGFCKVSSNNFVFC